jgi:hypothetical protein
MAPIRLLTSTTPVYASTDSANFNTMSLAKPAYDSVTMNQQQQQQKLRVAASVLFGSSFLLRDLLLFTVRFGAYS